MPRFRASFVVSNDKIMLLPNFTCKLCFLLLALACLTPWVSPPLALLIGIGVAQVLGHPFLHLNHRVTRVLLQGAVVGLGFGMNATAALHAGREGFLFTIFSIFTTLLLGIFLGRFLKVDQKTSWLISCGTAICGGSAIAAVSPVVGAGERSISVALGTVFILNAVALFIFPPVAHAIGLTQQQFGLWSAIAIHDTSSVVGAASRYGKEALEVATTVKLARALWIIPVAVFSSRAFKNKGQGIRIPWFILLFIAAILLHTYVPGLHVASTFIVQASHAALTLTLFLIGAGLNRDLLRGVGIKPLLQGLLLWIVIGLASLWMVLQLG